MELHFSGYTAQASLAAGQAFPHLILCSNMRAFSKPVTEAAKAAGIQLQGRKVLEGLLKIRGGVGAE